MLREQQLKTISEQLEEMGKTITADRRIMNKLSYAFADTARSLLEKKLLHLDENEERLSGVNTLDESDEDKKVRLDALLELEDTLFQIEERRLHSIEKMSVSIICLISGSMTVSTLVEDALEYNKTTFAMIENYANSLDAFIANTQQ